jgi:hypothetical protein
MAQIEPGRRVALLGVRGEVGWHGLLGPRDRVDWSSAGVAQADCAHFTPHPPAYARFAWPALIVRLPRILGHGDLGGEIRIEAHALPGPVRQRFGKVLAHRVFADGIDRGPNHRRSEHVPVITAALLPEPFLHVS